MFRHPIEARVNLTNGQQMLVEFDSSSSVAEVRINTSFVHCYIIILLYRHLL